MTTTEFKTELKNFQNGTTNLNKEQQGRYILAYLVKNEYYFADAEQAKYINNIIEYYLGTLIFCARLENGDTEFYIIRNNNYRYSFWVAKVLSDMIFTPNYFLKGLEEIDYTGDVENMLSYEVKEMEDYIYKNKLDEYFPIKNRKK